jgi:hypothetical protein
MCGKVHNYVKNRKYSSHDDDVYQPLYLEGMKFREEVIPIGKNYIKPHRYIEYLSNVYAMSRDAERMRMSHPRGNISASISHKLYHPDLVVEADDGKLYFEAGDGVVVDQPIRDVDGWHIINMTPRGYQRSKHSIGIYASMQFCVGAAGNLYKCARIFAGEYLRSQLTMRDPRCEFATFTGHTLPECMSNVDGLLICEQERMITIYDERANAMIGTDLLAGEYIGACRTR